MSKRALAPSELKLKKLAVLAKAYTDAVAAAGELKIYTKGTANAGYAKTYIISTAANATAAASDAKRMEIDIPKDFLVKSGKLLTVENGTGTMDGKLAVTKENGVAVTPYEAPSTIGTVGQWMDFVVNTAADGDGQAETDTHISINLDTFIDIYTGGNGIDITNKVVSIDLTADGGLELTGTDGAKKLGIKVYASGGLQTDSNGLSLKLKSAGGLESDANGAGIKLDSTVTGHNELKLSSNGLKFDQELVTDDEMMTWFGYNPANKTTADTPEKAIADAFGASGFGDSITDEA